MEDIKVQDDVLLGHEWYNEISPEEPISQGDILFNCPIYTPDTENFDFSNSDIEHLKNAKFKVYNANIIILTQACDLACDHGRIPVDQVIVAKLDDLKGESWTNISNIFSGNCPDLHMISKRDNGNITIDYQMVDFGNLYSLPYNLLAAVSQKHGLRLRVKSPFLELMSQRFGNYFARVALPQGISKLDLKSSWEKINPKS